MNWKSVLLVFGALAARHCNAGGANNPTPAVCNRIGPPVCDIPLDVFLVLDGSSSISSSVRYARYIHLTKFIANVGFGLIAQNFNQVVSATREFAEELCRQNILNFLSIVQYSGSRQQTSPTPSVTNLEVSLTGNWQQVFNAINRITQRRGRTDTEAGDVLCSRHLVCYFALSSHFKFVVQM